MSFRILRPRRPSLPIIAQSAVVAALAYSSCIDQTVPPNRVAVYSPLTSQTEFPLMGATDGTVNVMLMMLGLAIVEAVMSVEERAA